MSDQAVRRAVPPAKEEQEPSPAPGSHTRTDVGHAVASQKAVVVLRRARFFWLERVKRFVRHPLTQLIVAIILIVTSLIEASETFVDDLYNFKLRASHGLLVVGIVQVLAAIPDLIEGVERYLETADEHSAEEQPAEALPAQEQITQQPE